MKILNETVEKGVVERRFDLPVGEETVPGLHWLPEDADAPHPTVLIGHGGTQHKRVPNVLGLARKLVSELGYGVVALDAPGHGERQTPEDAAAMEERRRSRGAGGGGGARPGSPDRLRLLAQRAPQAVGEWKAMLDALEADERWARGPFGYWGVSMGTGFGLPFVADEPRIRAAVLGLAGLRDGNEAQLEAAKRLTIPVLFLFQWDDQLMSRESGLALWDAFGSEEKTMHINPGPHVGIPLFERDAVAGFYARHLGSAR